MTEKPTTQKAPELISEKISIEDLLKEIPAEFLEEEDEHQCCSCPEHMQR